MIETYLFETPWWLLGALAAVAIALLISGNARQNNRLKLAGFAALLLTIGLGATSYFVQTPREKAIQGSRQLVQAAVDRNPAIVQPLLHPNASLMHLGRDDLLHTLKVGGDTAGLRDAQIISIEADVTQSLITVTMTVISDHDPSVAFRGTYNSTWQLNWFETPQGWMLKDIIPLRLGAIEGGGALGNYLHRRPIP